jgi:hypothetical protein
MLRKTLTADHSNPMRQRGTSRSSSLTRRVTMRNFPIKATQLPIHRSLGLILPLGRNAEQGTSIASRQALKKPVCLLVGQVGGGIISPFRDPRRRAGWFFFRSGALRSRLTSSASARVGDRGFGSMARHSESPLSRDWNGPSFSNELVGVHALACLRTGFPARPDSLKAELQRRITVSMRAHRTSTRPFPVRQRKPTDHCRPDLVLRLTHPQWISPIVKE